MKLFLTLPEVENAVTLGQATILRMVRQDEFPKPRKLSGGRVGWLCREIEEWAESRPESDLPPPKNAGTGRKKKAQEQTI